MSTPASLSEALVEGRHGGKAAQLSQALRAGLPVPGGFALPFDFVEALAALDPAAMAALGQACSAVEWPVAARSSALGEDSEAASFAGQHLTVLNVGSPRELLDAVVAIRESGRSPSALAYRKRIGVVGEPRVGVVVQRLVPAEVAGVLFSRDPVTGTDEMIVEASWGLGEAVVGGLVVPDRFRLRRDGLVLERMAGMKDVTVRPLAAGGTAQSPVDAAQVRRLCLDDGQLASLHALARQCAAVFGGEQDLEWAFAEGCLYLLQRRAPTTLAPREGRAT